MLTWRGKRLRSIRKAEGDEAAHLADIAAMDRVLVNVLGFTGDIGEASRDFRREALFQRGELRRAVMVVLREANGPLTTRQITERVMSTKGKTLKPGRLSKEWIKRVRVVCNQLQAWRWCGRTMGVRLGRLVASLVSDERYYQAYG